MLRIVVRNLLLAALVLAGCGGGGGDDDAAAIDGAVPGDGAVAPDADLDIPGLGAHVLYTQDESLGTDPATSGAITTQARGSALVAFSMGWNGNFTAPADSHDNTWTQASDMNIYAGGNFYTAVWSAAPAQGGAGHTLTFAKPEHPSGEISMGMIEIVDAGAVTVEYRLAPSDDPSPPSVTTGGPATLIAIWGGDAFELSHDAAPDQGFAVIDAYLDLGPTSAVQVAVAAKEVTEAGTYGVTWTSSPAQGCACYLIAIER
jgi:hypothetical protein